MFKNMKNRSKLFQYLSDMLLLVDIYVCKKKQSKVNNYIAHGDLRLNSGP